MELKFSVIIPTYNRSATLGRAVKSVLSQTLPAWEIIVIDDGSSDGTREMMAAFPQVIYLYQSNSGVCAARNKGAKIATGDWLIFLDSDDELRSDSLFNFSMSIETSLKNLEIIFSNYCVVDDHKREIRSTSKLTGSYCFKKESFETIGGFDENITYGENSELFRRTKQWGFVHKKEKFITLNYYESAQGGSKNNSNIVSSNKYLLKKYFNYFEKNREEKAVYLQIIGVALLRQGSFLEASFYFWSCIKINKFKLEYWIRYMISRFPKISKMVYPVIDNKIK